MVPAAFGVTAAVTAMAVGVREKRLRKAREGEQGALFE